MKLITRIKKALEWRWAKSSSNRFTKWLRKKGCKVGIGVRWYGLPEISIDTTRPSLIEIGNDVCFTCGCTILTHGFDWFVLRNLYHEMLCSSGKVKIGNNIFIGTCTIILKGVTIGDNCIIGAGSIVTEDIPANSVAVGSPAKVVCSIEDYYNKRKKEYVEEAKAYARSIKQNFGRPPVPSDFWEEFPLFMKAKEKIDGISEKKQLGKSYEIYKKNHLPLYNDFESFIKDSGLK